MKNYAVIVAGGSGLRFGSALPKQFLPLCGKPVLMHTLERFASAVECELIVVLPQLHQSTWRELCIRYGFTLAHRVVDGGATRHESVSHALSSIDVKDADAVVAIHDGVRPLVSASLIAKAYDVARATGSAVPAVSVTDSIRLIGDDGVSRQIDRSTLRAVQTPQVFLLQKIKKAYLQPYDETMTDDATVFERMGEMVTLIDGEPDNIKITNAKDLKLAQLLMNDE